MGFRAYVGFWFHCSPNPGYAQNGAGNGDVATRWVDGGSTESLGTLAGGTQSIALAASADGTYIVGASQSSVASVEAMIWSELSGMQGLGLLTDGTMSIAEGVSANGAVVVGMADTTGSVYSGFRWTAETGMQSLVEWLQDNDPSYTLLANNTLNSATAVSADGNTVFGLGFLNGRSQPFVARSYGPISEPVVTTPPVTDTSTPSTGGSSSTGSTSTGSSNSGASTGSTGTGANAGSTGGTDTGASAGDAGATNLPTGVIGLLDLGDSLQNATLYAQAMQNQLQGFVQDQLTCSTFDTNGVCVSVSSQMTHHSGTVQGDNVYGGVTAAYRLTPDLVAGIGYQGPSTSLKINDDRVEGDTNTIGAFVEYGNRLRKGVFARGAVAVSEGDATIKRSYKTGAGDDESKGKSDVSQRAVSGQVGYVFILQDNIAVMPFLGVDYLNTKLDSYTETSGSFPARFDKRTEENIYGTAGLNASMNLANKAIVSANIKHVSRLNNSQDDLTGDVIGVSRFDMKQDTTERWNEVGVGLQVAGPFKASRVGVTYGHRFGSDKAVASDVATLSLSIGF
ncbi:autotransporter subunit beta [Pseudomonas taiwanensis SJ9]|uniref:Autotransporter subunit beta n=1 Tax=Pseudomonas taiwanensis SJ9 TaxID=1388762 RepID=V7DAN1_9PSED|nr:autotransporter subunit beta [Pseudomonas taiwanensis SJ9]